MNNLLRHATMHPMSNTVQNNQTSQENYIRKDIILFAIMISGALLVLAGLYWYDIQTALFEEWAGTVYEFFVN